MTEFICKALAERKLGMSLHYPFLHGAVIGLNARRTLEFGAGGSTRVIIDAQCEIDVDSLHTSLSTQPRDEVISVFVHSRLPPAYRGWSHRTGDSRETCKHVDVGTFDLVLHDGSHAADVVAGDITWAWPRLRRFGLLLVHDTLHSYVGEQVRQGLRNGLARADAGYSQTTLPYGFGLTVITKLTGQHTIEPAKAKRGSPHTTDLMDWML